MKLRELGFWYLASGLALIAFGVTMAEGVWAVLLVPSSDLWLLLPLAAIAAIPPSAARRAARAATRRGGRR